MSHTLTVRLTSELAAWLEEESRKTGVSQGKIVRDQLERARAGRAAQSFNASGRRHARAAGSLAAEGLLARMKGIADTGLLVAFLNRNDAHHD